MCLDGICVSRAAHEGRMSQRARPHERSLRADSAACVNADCDVGGPAKARRRADQRWADQRYGDGRWRDKNRRCGHGPKTEPAVCCTAASAWGAGGGLHTAGEVRKSRWSAARA